MADSYTTQTKDSTPITESRIIYKRKQAADEPITLSGFSERTMQGPEFYLDPNELMRARAKFEIAEAKEGRKPGATPPTAIAAKPPDTAPTSASSATKTADPAAQKASAEVKK